MSTVFLKPPFRQARKEDCYGIAELVRMSSGGVADCIWGAADDSGLDLLEIGEQCFAREDAEVSYKNCVVAEMDGELAGVMVSFVETDRFPDYGPATAAKAGDADVLAPYRALAAPGSYYIRDIALLPQYQSQGLGTRLYETAKVLARPHECSEMSLRIFEQNVGAVRLCERLGFTEIARQPLVPHELIRYTGDILLLTAPVAVGATAR